MKNLKSNKILYIFLSLLPFVYYYNQSIFQSNIDFLLQYNQSFFDYFYSWGDWNFGINKSNFIWEAFPLGLYFYLLNNFNVLGVNFPQILLLSSLVIFGFVSFRICANELLFGKVDRNALTIGSIFFIFNLFFITQLSNSYFLVIPYVLLPLQVFLFFRGIRINSIFVSSFIIALLNILTFGVNFVYGIIFYTLISLLGIWSIYIEKFMDWKKFYRPFLASIMLTVLTCSWWLLPTILSTYSNPSDTSFILQSEDFYNLDSVPTNVFRNLGYWSFFSSYKGTLYREFSPLYDSGGLLVIFSFIIPILVLTQLILMRTDKNESVKKRTWFFLILITVLLPVIGGSNPRWFSGTIFKWLFDNVPYMNIFRNTYKFSSLLTFCYSIVLVSLFSTLLKKLSLVWQKNLYFWLVTSVILITSYPLLSGNVFSKSVLVSQIPNYWLEMTEYVNDHLDVNNARLLLLPDQYFTVFDWEGEFKSLPKNIADSLFDVPNVYGTCAGCGPYKSLEVIDFLFDNLEHHNIASFLGILNISHILQRNDFSYEFYGSRTPTEVKNVISSDSFQSLNTIGMLDLYQIDPELVNAKIYVPEKMYLYDSYTSVIDSIDIIDSPENKFTFFLYRDVSKKVIGSLNVKRRIFQNKNISVDNNELIDTGVLIGDQEHLFAKSVGNSQETINELFAVDNGHITYKGDTFNDTNLIENGNFETGVWEAKVRNCKKTKDDAEIYMELVDTNNGNKAIELVAYEDSACTRFKPVSNFNSNHYYRISFDYKIKAGSSMQYCVWDGLTCLDLKTVDSSIGDWHSHEVVVKPNERSRQIVLYLYADSLSGNVSIVQYTNVIVNSINNQTEDFYVENVNPYSFSGHEVNFVKRSPVSYEGIIRTYDLNPFVLSFMETYHPMWRVYINGIEVLPEDHLVVNGYANGWWIEATRFCSQDTCLIDADKVYNIPVVIEFATQYWLYLGLLISGTTLAGCLGYLGYEGVKSIKLKVERRNKKHVA